jgi:hypothetical protein
MVKTGFIEMIEENKVVVIFDDFSKGIYDKSLFPNKIKINMLVTMNEDEVLEVKENSEQIKNEIEDLTSKIFCPFKNKKNS